MNKQQLPIRLTADIALFENMQGIKRMLFQLEAWLNFETMRAGWYGDEEQVLSCLISIVSVENFQQKSQDPAWQQWMIEKEPPFMWLDLPKKMKINVLLPLSKKELIQYSDINHANSTVHLEAFVKQKIYVIIEQLTLHKKLPAIAAL